MISLRQVTVQAGGFHLREVSLEIPTGSHTALMGRTGSGKTTLLEGICGLRPVLSGSVWIGGRDVTALPPGERGIGFVPQDGALFDPLTVRQHLEFALELRGWSADRRARRSDELAGWLGLTPLLDRWPAGLSGGERQRVALGRALAFHPRVLCLDEPLSALDDQTRGEMVALLKEIRSRTGITLLHITHNRSEAECLADRILQLREGRLES
ncbi:MAG: Sulfate/thiosulfate import ATP-binding protein CysA [Verrucomicrobiota bacterium]|jgi:molybdate/tungstate transport system ATP-binding protein